MPRHREDLKEWKEVLESFALAYKNDALWEEWWLDLDNTDW